VIFQTVYRIPSKVFSWKLQKDQPRNNWHPLFEGSQLSFLSIFFLSLFFSLLPFVFLSYLFFSTFLLASHSLHSRFLLSSLASCFLFSWFFCFFSHSLSLFFSLLLSSLTYFSFSSLFSRSPLALVLSLLLLFLPSSFHFFLFSLSQSSPLLLCHKTSKWIVCCNSLETCPFKLRGQGFTLHILKCNKQLQVIHSNLILLSHSCSPSPKDKKEKQGVGEKGTGEEGGGMEEENKRFYCWCIVSLLLVHSQSLCTVFPPPLLYSWMKVAMCWSTSSLGPKVFQFQEQLLFWALFTCD